MRRNVPFGTDWAMPVDVRVSEWVVAHGIGWSCGQCPLDGSGGVVAPGDVEAQAALVAERIEAGLGRAGLATDGVLALVVYGASPARSAAVLRARLPAGAAIVPVAVPPLYYDGMTLEVDVLAAAVPVARSTVDGVATAAAPGLTAVAWTGRDGAPPEEAPTADMMAARAGRADAVALSTLLALPPRAAAPAGWSPGSIRRTPAGAEPAALLLLSDGTPVTDTTTGDGVVTEIVDAGPLLRVGAWCADPGGGIAGQAAAAMSAAIAALAARGLGPEALVKVSAHHVGEGAAALHESLAARHRHHVRPGPASTGLGVAGLGPEGAAVVIEAIAAR